MSQCWSRSHSPAGFDIVFSHLEFPIPTSFPAFGKSLCLTPYSCILYCDFRNLRLPVKTNGHWPDSGCGQSSSQLSCSHTESRDLFVGQGIRKTLGDR